MLHCVEVVAPFCLVLNSDYRFGSVQQPNTKTVRNICGPSYCVTFNRLLLILVAVQSITQQDLA